MNTTYTVEKVANGFIITNNQDATIYIANSIKESWSVGRSSVERILDELFNPRAEESVPIGEVI